MSAILDKLVGLAMITVATVVFVYYTIWALILPFVDEPNPIHQFFPAREWAVRIPLALLLVGLTAIGSFIGMVMVRTAAKEKKKKSA
ncbi:hypothetical protein CANCADRAFT_139932 [Tortispora caseinolytica NRRL Y-17796]|uniref:Dolichol phosphate-mannose biosynthesis regulatory protein n=1 Tax=Tortispora caseinolytica NRRL Y-17796 TaxID=767744 RepID=A0A1E4TCQ7_9ASCO|nr:hypothetical protein CANCADRAFT_139932 [Tortispora caseinolytica NRRL Y-17796]